MSRQAAQPIDLISGPHPDFMSGTDNAQEATATNYVSMELGDREDASPSGNNTNDDDAQSIAMSSVLTADGISDVPGFLVVCLVILIGDMSRGIFFPTLWPLVSSLGGSTVTLGYAVAAFSGGRIITSPIFGSWSVSMGYTKTLKISVSLLVLGTLLYAQVQNVGSCSFLIFSQMILGVGSGTLGVTRAFVADVTAKRERTGYMALITAVQYGGFTMTPAVGALLSYLLGDSEVLSGAFRLNQFTAPAYVMSFICLATLACIHLFFKDRERVKTKKEAKVSKKQSLIDEVANGKTCFKLLTVYDATILGCMLLNVATKGSIASFETLGINYAETHFEMSSSTAGVVVGACGTMGVMSLLSMGYLSLYFTDIQLVCGGIIVMSCGIVSLTGIAEGTENDHWRYFMAIFLIYSVGYPIGHTAVIGLFSKIVGRRPQGLLLGWFASAGSLARMIFPVMSGYVADLTDIVVLFMILTVVLIVAAGFVMYSRSTLNMLSA